MNLLTVQERQRSRTLSDQNIVQTADPLKPMLKWAGGKRWLLPHLMLLWNAHAEKRLVEPFAGGLAVALGLRPTSALINDINPHLINFYRWVKIGLRIEKP